MTPSVTAILLTADRQQQTDRAVASFLAQTYKQSHLLIYDTGKKPYRIECLASSRIIVVHDGAEMARPIGALRNTANSLAPPGTEILIHWDSDDWSGPYRIQDQVQSLLDSGKECVGYRSVLFWDRRKAPEMENCRLRSAQQQITYQQGCYGEAWAYYNIQLSYCIGASFCYWRKVWERQKFREDLPGPERGMGEDKEWLNHVDSLGETSIHGDTTMLVCEIHGGNTMKYSLDDESRGPTGWKRVSEWDAKLQEIMQL